MTIDEPIRSNTATSDFEEFKKFFELMEIKYEIPADNLIYLSGFEVNSSQLIVIKFYEDGRFQEFCPYPETFPHTEWLMKLKNLREENKVLTSECDRLIKEKGELNKLKEKAVLDICQREARLKEAKRLLKSAIDEWNLVCEWGNCGEYCGWFENGKCTQEWSNKAEALKLIGETNVDQ